MRGAKARPGHTRERATTADENGKQPVGAEGARDLAGKELEAVSGGAADEQGLPVCPTCGKSDMMEWIPAAHEAFCRRCWG